MDLNQLYSQHQIALIRADNASVRSDRAQHLDRADHIANRIGDYQRSRGAQAGAAWRSVSHALHSPMATGRKEASN